MESQIDQDENEPMKGTRSSSADSRRGSSSPPDGKYGWAVCAAGGYVMFCGIGTLMCYGVLYVELLDYFDEGRTKTSWIGAFCFLSLAFAGPISSNVANRFSHRLSVMIGGVLASMAMLISAFATSIYYLYISFGLLGGIGIGLAWIPSISIVAMYFDNKRSLAIGLATSCGGVAFLIFPVMMNACIDLLSWRGTVIVLACLWMQACVCGALMRPLGQKECIRFLRRKHCHKKATDNTGKGCVKTCDVTLFKMWQFWVYILLEYLFRIDFLTFPTILPDFTILNGYDMERSTLLLIIYGAVSIPARWLGGYVADRPRVNSLLFLSISIAALSMTSLAMPFTTGHFAAMGVVCALRGAVSGILEVLQPTVLILLFGEKRVTTTIGYDMVAINAGQLTSTPLAGIIYDVTGNYLYSYLTCSCISILGAILAFALFLNNQRICYKAKQVSKRKSLQPW